MPTTEFQRARAPEQIQQRKVALLQAARTLLLEGGVDAVTLTAIARQAGLAKSNVYRYFESREHILLELLVDDELLWVSDLERSLAPLGGCDDPAKVAEVITASLLEHSMACQLIAVVANVLEHNVSPEQLRGFKTRVLEVSIRLGNALHATLPSLRHEVTPTLLRLIHATIAGLWPMGHPGETICRALEEPQFGPLLSTWSEDVKVGLELLLRGASTGAR